jgi:predicted metal-dependent hydrolase
VGGAGVDDAGGRFRGALAFGVSRLRKREYVAAHHDFLRAAAAAPPDERELARGLAHLAAAGYRRARGDGRGAARQLAHARRRLAPFLPAARGLDLAALLASVEDGG